MTAVTAARTSATRAGRSRRLTVAVIAPLRHPLGEPHAGGQEAAVHDRVRLLRGRGHRVLLVAVEGSRPAATASTLRLPAVRWGPDEVPSDSTYPRGYLHAADAAMSDALTWLATRSGEIDVIDNHSLHPAPLERAAELGVPMLTTLHTPPLAPLLGPLGGTASRLVAVSEHAAEQWRAVIGRPVEVMHNMVDTATWRLGPGGSRATWFGRIVPEKAPHLAIAAARAAGLGLDLAGRIGDDAYFRNRIAPLLGHDIRHLGELRARDLARLVGTSAAVMVTPVWDEPFGLVLAETLATGTPVAAFARGGIAEVARGNPGASLVPPSDVSELATTLGRLVLESSPARRRTTRAAAVRRFSYRRHALELERLLSSVARRYWATEHASGVEPAAIADAFRRFEAEEIGA